MKVKTLLFLFVSFCSLHTKLEAQNKRIRSYQLSRDLPSAIDAVQFRNIGPTIMSGRVTDIEVNPINSTEFYVAYASGGLWHTVNNGHSFVPLFDNEASITIGDIAVDWKTRTIWIGTGEVNSSRSSYAGVGVYKSSDSGKNWQHMGLVESHHIGRILLHPTDPAIAWVAVLGHLYTANEERGVYKTTDGGKSWEHTLYISDTTGCVDVQADPLHPEILYASAWSRTRKAWQFNGTGKETALYKSTDGGVSWTRISGAGSGLPMNDEIGRIGISVSASDPEVVYALVDNNMKQPAKSEAGKERKMKASDLALLKAEDFLLLEDEKLEEYLRDNGYPEKYSAQLLKRSIRDHEFSVRDIADWKLSDADNNLFETPIYGAELYRSDDGGMHWVKTHSDVLSGVYFTYGYYFGTVQVSPVNENKVLIAGYPLLLSTDGGKTFKQIDGDNCHPDYHRLWIDPANDKHFITGNDGGINITYDDGTNWYKANNPAVGQFYAIQVDNAVPYNVYGGLQDNGTWVGPSTHKENTGWHQNGTYAYTNIGGGDGMQVQVDTRDNATLYTGYQFGNYNRSKDGREESVKPVHTIGEKALRFNWQTPIHLSRHNQDIFYIGSNKFHRSMQQGRDMKTLSDDLTTNSKKGNVPFGTLTTIHESPLRFGLIYCGTDDGQVHVSKDAGYTWELVMQHKWVSRVCAGNHKEGTVYVSCNGYREDDFEPYVFASYDYGENWKRIGKNLPPEPVNVIREDPKDERILYAGTDNGLYISFNGGADFEPWKGGLPRVAIHDIAIQERDNEIVLGTHGRSIYISPLDKIQAYNKVKDKESFVFEVKDLRYRKDLGNKSYSYMEAGSQKMDLYFYTRVQGNYRMEIRDSSGVAVYTQQGAAKAGLNSVSYDLRINSHAGRVNGVMPEKRDDGNRYLPAGMYQVHFDLPSGQQGDTSFKLKAGKDN